MGQRNAMREIVRFSFTPKDENIRNIVTQSANGMYHISEEVRPLKRGNIYLVSLREDIHGPMDSTAYTAWLQNIVFNHCHKHATAYERAWLLE